jgi:PAS domain S-box-containing protein
LNGSPTGAELPERSDIDGRIASGDEALFRRLLDLLAEPVTIRDPAGELVYANRAALASLGFASIDQLRSRPTVDIMDDYRVEDEHGRTLAHQDIPSMRVLEGDEVEPLLMRTVHRETGEVRWVLLTTTRLSIGPEFVGAMTEIRDLTALKTAERRMKVLADSGRLLASSMDYRATLSKVADLAVPALADFCSIDLLTAAGGLERVVVTHAAPERAGVAARLASLGPARLADNDQTERVLATGSSLFASEISANDESSLARDQLLEGLLRELAPRSLLLVPLRVPGRSIGAMTLATDVSLRRLDDDDLELAEQLGRRAAVAVENARLQTQLIEVAETLQRGLLPPPPPDIPGWEVSSLYRPIETALRFDVGGDFYEFIEHEGAQFVILGDVAGKGVTAASVTALLRHGARVASTAEPSPAAILGRLDEALTALPGEQMATAACLSLHSDHVLISSAGHPAAIIVNSDGRIREAPSSDAMLGAFDNAERHDEQVPVDAGELLLLYTDGIIDARRPDGERFGSDRLRSEIRSLGSVAPGDVLATLDALLSAFTDGRGADDVAALAMRRRR